LKYTTALAALLISLLWGIAAVFSGDRLEVITSVLYGILASLEASRGKGN
jgi:hypothetical protein